MAATPRAALCPATATRLPCLLAHRGMGDSTGTERCAHPQPRPPPRGLPPRGRLPPDPSVKPRATPTTPLTAFPAAAPPSPSPTSPVTLRDRVLRSSTGPNPLLGLPAFRLGDGAAPRSRSAAEPKAQATLPPSASPPPISPAATPAQPPIAPAATAPPDGPNLDAPCGAASGSRDEAPWRWRASEARGEEATAPRPLRRPGDGAGSMCSAGGAWGSMGSEAGADLVREACKGKGGGGGGGGTW